MVLSDIEKFTIRPLSGEEDPCSEEWPQCRSAEEIDNARQDRSCATPGNIVAQPQDCDALTISYHDGRKVMRRQDHILFALAQVGRRDTMCFPGALTRVSTEDSPFTANELGGGSKDTPGFRRCRTLMNPLRTGHASSRGACCPRSTSAAAWRRHFIGPDGIRARAQSGGDDRRHRVALELEELNPTERTVYRPVWNRILPPLENPGSVSRRNISSPAGRYRLDARSRGARLGRAEPSCAPAAIRKSILECLEPGGLGRAHDC